MSAHALPVETAMLSTDSCERCGRQDMLGASAGWMSTSLAGAVTVVVPATGRPAVCGLCATTIPGAPDVAESWSWLAFVTPAWFANAEPTAPPEPARSLLDDLLVAA